MVLPIVMAAVAVGSAVAGAISRGRASSAQKALIEEQIEIQRRADDLLASQRKLEQRQSFFEFEKGQRLFRLQNQEKILQANVAKQMADMDLMNQTLQTQQQLFAVGQQRSLAEQEGQQARRAGFDQAGQAVAANGEQRQKLEQGIAQQNVISGATGQDNSRRSQAGMENAANASAQNAANINVGLEDSRNSIENEYNQNAQLFDMQAQLSRAGVQTQQQIFEVQNQALKSKLEGDQEVYRLERRAFNQASRANRIAEREKELRARETDKLTSKANKIQMKAGMPQAPSTLGTIFEVGGQVAGAVYGAQQYFANRWTPPSTPTTGAISSGGSLFTNASSYSNSSSVRFTPMTSASYPDLSGRGGYPSTIFTPPPATGINRFGTVQDVVQSGRA